MQRLLHWALTDDALDVLYALSRRNAANALLAAGAPTPKHAQHTPWESATDGAALSDPDPLQKGVLKFRAMFGSRDRLRLVKSVWVDGHVPDPTYIRHPNMSLSVWGDALLNKVRYSAGNGHCLWPLCSPVCHLLHPRCSVQVDRLERSFSGPLPTHRSGGHEPPASYDTFPWWVVVVPVVGLCVCALSTWTGGRGRTPHYRQPRERKTAPRAKTQQWSQFSAFKS
jgi:hypothetical protein